MVDDWNERKGPKEKSQFFKDKEKKAHNKTATTNIAKIKDREGAMARNESRNQKELI